VSSAPRERLIVTALRESPRQPGRYSVQLSDGRRFVLGVGALTSLGITRENSHIDEATAAKLEHEGAVSALTARALSSLARARRTRFELQQRLRRFEPDAAIVALALDRMENQGLLSDRDAAHAEASARLRRGEGPSRVRQVLRSKGIDQRTADEALENAIVGESYDERDQCWRLAERRYQSLRSLDSQVARRRLGGFLARRGYTASTVRSVVDEVMKNPSGH